MPALFARESDEAANNSCPNGYASGKPKPEFRRVPQWLRMEKIHPYILEIRARRHQRYELLIGLLILHILEMAGYRRASSATTCRTQSMR